MNFQHETLSRLFKSKENQFYIMIICGGPIAFGWKGTVAEWRKHTKCKDCMFRH